VDGLGQHFDEGPPKTARPGEIIAYYKIASHYKWALTQLFNKRKFERVIILEDDMEIAPDFFKYFEATSHLLDNDRCAAYGLFLCIYYYSSMVQ
jgi:alpha-1,3-mannosyl-glycoprotein beta-1,2-N-acetylglucosaminyltransferase